MARWLIARRTISGNPERLEEALVTRTPELLQVATDSAVEAPAGDGSFTLRLHGRKGGADAHKEVRAHVAEARRRSGWVSVPVRWEAEAGRMLFPSFEGAIEMAELSPSSVELTVVGHYRPPLGPIGDALDLTLLSDVAQGTVTWLAHRLARAIIDRVYGDAAPEVRRGTAMIVADVMSREVLTIGEDASLRAAASLLLHAGVSGLPVVDRHGRVIGVISQRDLLDKAATPPTGLGRAFAEAGRHHRAITVGQACSRPALTTEADTPLREAAREMADRDVERLVVLDGAAHVGIITRSDVLQALVRDDDVIADAIREEIDGITADGDVRVDVSGGIVTLAGEVQLRTHVERIQEAARAVDGVLTIRDDLTWRVDDIVPVMPPLV